MLFKVVALVFENVISILKFLENNFRELSLYEHGRSEGQVSSTGPENIQKLKKIN